MPSEKFIIVKGRKYKKSPLKEKNKSKERLARNRVHKYKKQLKER